MIMMALSQCKGLIKSSRLAGAGRQLMSTNGLHAIIGTLGGVTHCPALNFAGLYLGESVWVAGK